MPLDQRSLIHHEAQFPGEPRIPQNPNCLKNRKKSSKTQKLKKHLGICQNQRYAFDQRSLIHQEAWFPPCFVGQRIPQTSFFFNGKKSTKTQKLKKVQKYAKICDTPFDQRSLIHREAWFPPCFVGQNQQKKNFFCAAILYNFQTKMFKSETTSFHYFSPRIPNL